MFSPTSAVGLTFCPKSLFYKNFFIPTAEVGLANGPAGYIGG